MIVSVEIDGRARTVDVVSVPGGWSVLLDGRSHEVALDARQGHRTLYVGGRAIPLAPSGAARFGSGRGVAEAGSGPTRIVAPMPGRIVKVLVACGDAVVARQGLVVIEAMKMENELRASGPGTVTEVKVMEGASVDAHALLIVIT